MNAMTVAIAKAAKVDNAKRIQQSVLHSKEEYNTNSTTAQLPPPKLYRAVEVAEKVGCSVSYVYLMISKLKPHIWAMDGNASLYGDEFIEEMNSLPRKKFSHRVRTEARKQQPMHADVPVKQQESVATEQQKENNPISLIERIANLEHRVIELSKLLGI